MSNDRGFCSVYCSMMTFLLPRLLRYGPNSIDVPVKPYHLLFVEEVLHPFYIFQILCIVQWMNEQYYYYSGGL